MRRGHVLTSVRAEILGLNLKGGGLHFYKKTVISADHRVPNTEKREFDRIGQLWEKKVQSPGEDNWGEGGKKNTPRPDFSLIGKRMSWSSRQRRK